MWRHHRSNGTASCAHAGHALRPLSADIRRVILTELTEAELDVSTLANRMQTDIAVVSAHLRRLRRDGVVAVSRTKQHRFYSLDAAELRNRSGRCRVAVPCRSGDQVIVEVKATVRRHGR